MVIYNSYNFCVKWWINVGCYDDIFDIVIIIICPASQIGRWPCQPRERDRIMGATSRPLLRRLNTTWFQHFFNSTNSFSTLLDFNTSAFNTSCIQHYSNSTSTYSTHLAFNTPCIQQFLYSTLLDFNNHGFNTTWFQQSWIQQSLFSTNLDSTILVFNTLGFNNPCFQQSLFSTHLEFIFFFSFSRCNILFLIFFKQDQWSSVLGVEFP